MPVRLLINDILRLVLILEQNKKYVIRTVINKDYITVTKLHSKF